MFIYLDETFNLIKGRKHQFMAVAGFSTYNSSETAKWYRKVKRRALPASYPKGEIKSSNALSDLYILPYMLKPSCLIPPLKVYAVLQEKNFLSQEYYYKNKLVYDRLYINIIKRLLLEIDEIRVQSHLTIVTLDSYKTKFINKENLAITIETELKLEHPDINIKIEFGTSEEANLQIADQICGIIHSYVTGDRKALNMLKKKAKVNLRINVL